MTRVYSVLFFWLILTSLGLLPREIILSKPAEAANDHTKNEKNPEHADRKEKTDASKQTDLNRQEESRNRQEKQKKDQKDAAEKNRIINNALEKNRQDGQRADQGRLKHEQKEFDKVEKERMENELREDRRLEKEKQDQEQKENEVKERQSLEKEKLDRELKEKEQIERDKLENDLKEKQKLEKELKEKERFEKDKLDKELKEKERLEKEKLDNDQKEKQRLEKEKQIDEQKAKELKEKQRLEKEKLDNDQKEKQRIEREKLDSDLKEKQRTEREKLDKDQKEQQRLQSEKLESEQREKQRVEKEKLEKQHEIENQKYGFTNAAKKGKKPASHTDSRGTRQTTAETSADSKAGSEILQAVFKLNISAVYSLYPYENSSFNFIKNSFSADKISQELDSTKKFYINIDGGAGILQSPDKKWGVENAMIFTTLHSRFFSLLGPFAEYRGYRYSGEILNNYFASLDLAIIQFLSFSLSVHGGYTYLKSTTIHEGGPTVGLLIQWFPFKPISLQFRYSIMESPNLIVDTTSARIGVHINRFEIFAGYYRFRINDSPFQGVETGFRLWM